MTPSLLARHRSSFFIHACPARDGIGLLSIRVIFHYEHRHEKK